MAFWNRKNTPKKMKEKAMKNIWASAALIPFRWFAFNSIQYIFVILRSSIATLLILLLLHGIMMMCQK
jgi:hypothetical protein